MEYKKLINLLDTTLNQPTKFRTRNLVEINDGSQAAYNVKVNNSNNIKFKTSLMRSNLLDYSDAYTILDYSSKVPNAAV